MASSQKPLSDPKKTTKNNEPVCESKVKNDEQSETPIYEPEPSNSELLIKPACDCKNCHHWTNSADWCMTPDLEFETPNKKGQKERKIQPLLRSAKYPGKSAKKIFSFSCNNLTKIEKQSVFKTLVQGETIPQPVQLLSDTYFDDNIQHSLKGLNYKYSKPIQSFAWPAIFRQLNVFLIGSPKSGKTMAYLPAVCTFASQPEQKYQELAKYKGPLIVIVCPNSKQCEEIFDLIKKINVKPKVMIMTYPVTNTNNMDILITMPDSLMHCIKSRIFNLKRLCHLVLEDTSTLLRNEEKTIYEILNGVNQMLEHRANNTKVQLIVSSIKWTSHLKQLMKLMYLTPLVCIGNHLEGALYGNIHFEIKFLMSEQKKAYLADILKKAFHIYKTLIVCEDSEITEVCKWLVRNGIETIALSDNSAKEDIDGGEMAWTSAKGGQCKVLLCTDFILESLLSVNEALWLINYSFPSTWSAFTKRFSALSSHFKSPLESNEGQVQCKSFLMIDETCETQMPKILNLLSRLSKDLPPNYQKYADGFKVKSENEKILNKVKLCDTLKLLGKCPIQLCEKRHMVAEDLDVSRDLPENGKIVFKILEIKDVTQYTVQLIQHIDMNGVAVKFNNDDLKEPLVYDPNIEKKRVVEPQVGKFYGHCDYTTDGEVFMLCHVLKIESDKFVEVKLTSGLTLQTLKNKLYEVPSGLKIVDIYLCNLIPPYKDESFSGRSFYVTRSSLESIDYKEMVLTADIHLQLDETLWLNNVVQEFKIADGSTVTKFNLIKHLLNIEVVELCKSHITALHKLCAKCDITLPLYTKPTQKKVAKVKEIDPQRSFLDENINEVILSSAVTPEEFYVRLFKYQSLLDNLEKDIQNAVKNEVLDKNVNVSIGKYYLALDPSGDLYARVLILNIQDDKALCFYVDFGDEAVVDISEIKNLPTKLITKLPFQAIQCRLHGINPAFGEWEDQATEVLYKYLFEPDSDIFRSLFVKVCDKEKSDTIRTKLKYSVLIKDGFATKNTLINQLLIDCGFATSIFDQFDDFELPSRDIKRDSADSDSEENGSINEDLLEKFDEKDLDIEIFDAGEFLEMFGPPGLKTVLQTPQLTHETKNDDQKNVNVESNTDPGESTSKDEVPSKHFTPEVYWSQTDKTVKLKIKLVGVNDYKVNVIKKRIFTFWTKLDDKNYELKFTLYKMAEITKHCATGQEVQVALNKTEPLEWLQLTGTKKRMRNIHYEIPDGEEKKPKRKFLQLDISDDESDADDNVMFHEISDLDSEFDEEAPLSSSD